MKGDETKMLSAGWDGLYRRSHAVREPKAGEIKELSSAELA
jgi:hypothetical protein